MSKQIFNSAWHKNGSVNYEEAPMAVSRIKNLRRLLLNKELLFDVLILAPVFAALLIVMLSF